MVAVNDLYPEVIKICRPLIIEDEILKSLVKRFSNSIEKSLRVEYLSESTVKCNPTHVTDFPTGQEKGSFIGLEFSGRVFRIVYGGLKGDRSYTSVSRLYEFPDNKLNEGLIKVVDYVARCVNNFVETYDIYERRTILGVATSFPMIQDSLQEGKFTEWSPDFQSKTLINQDFFTQLKVSLKKFKNTKRIYLISLVSTATAYLLSGIYQDPAIRLGLFLGEETNLTYVEKYENITAYTGDGLRTRTALAVDLKSYGDDGDLDFLRTDFDYQIDDASSNPGQFVLEKITSASHLGEVARLCLCELAKYKHVLKGVISPQLGTKGSLKTEDLAIMEMDEEKKFCRCRAVMRGLGYKEVSDSDCLQIRFVSRCVVRRSSNLVAAYLTAMIQRIGSKLVRIMGGGFLLRDYPNYEHYLVKKMNQLKKPEIRFDIVKAGKDDVAVGGGIAAIIYKDEIIKREDKHRLLPPININKLKLKDLPSSLTDCECHSNESEQSICTTTLSEASQSEASQSEIRGSEFGSVCSKPVYANSLSFESSSTRN